MNAETPVASVSDLVDFVRSGEEPETSIADAVKRSMMTDIPISALPQLVELLPKVDRDGIVSVRFIPPEYHLKFRDDGGLGRIANNVCGEPEAVPTEDTSAATSG